MTPLRRTLALVCAALLALAGCGAGEPEGGSGARRETPPPTTASTTPAGTGGAAKTAAAKQANGGWAIVWRRGRGAGGEVVKVGTGVVAVGPVGGAARRYLLAEPERSREVLSFTRTYAPFRVRAGGGVLELRGKGRVRPAAAERRMIYEWTRQVAAEAGGAEPGSGFGLLLTWQRVSGSGCDEVTVYLSGEVRTGRCGGPNAIAGRLAPGSLAWLYERFDRLAPFQDAATPAALGMSPRLVFAGRGREAAGAEDRRDLEALGAALARPAGSPLLLPPRPALPLPEVILPDDRLPPPPPVPRD